MQENGWSLETVRGRESGRVYPLGRGETVLGNALDGGPGLDLAHQEGDSPRRMAARQAQLDHSPQGLAIRDLDSPGGTFVNRQRLLPGQSRVLQTGDVLQLGGVQLKVVAGQPAPPPAPAPAAGSEAVRPQPAASVASTQSGPSPPPRAAAPPPAAARAARAAPAAAPAAKGGPLAGVFTLASGARCRTWDDFLTVSAQRWPAMRDELVSGRLAAFLATAGRGDLAPSADAPGTPDERLDAWLGSLPTTRPGRPELDVHPAALTLRAAPGGGIVGARLQITNTGYRLLRTTVRVEPATAGWLKIPGALAHAPIVTVDQSELPIEVHVPESFDVPPAAALVLESNGGARRVEVRLERPVAPDVLPEGPSAAGPYLGLGLRGLIERQPAPWRLVTWALAALLLRLLVIASGLIFAAGPGEGRPPLGPAALLFAAVGCVAALQFALRHGELRDVPSAGFAGAAAGVLAATVLIAACRTIEPRLGAWLSASPVAVSVLWGALGAILALISLVLVPPRSEEEKRP